MWPTWCPCAARREHPREPVPPSRCAEERSAKLAGGQGFSYTRTRNEQCSAASSPQVLSLVPSFPLVWERDYKDVLPSCDSPTFQEKSLRRYACCSPSKSQLFQEEMFWWFGGSFQLWRQCRGLPALVHGSWYIHPPWGERDPARSGAFFLILFALSSCVLVTMAPVPALAWWLHRR